MATATSQTTTLIRDTPVLYKVKPGDSPAHILRTYYQTSENSRDYLAALALFQAYNPHIGNIDMIRSGQILRLMPLKSPSGLSYCPAPESWLKELAAQDAPAIDPSDLHPGTGVLQQFSSLWPAAPADESAFWALAMLQDNYNWLAVPTGAGLDTLGRLTGHGNNTLLQQVEMLYQQYKRGAITKGQYDAGRRRVLKQYAQMVGPFERFVMGGRTTNETIRISRLKGLPATHRIQSELMRLNRLSTLASRGGVLLAAGGVYMGCRQIAAANSRQEKNEIFVETAISTGVGAATGLVIGVVLASNPVGWTIALTLAAGTAATSWLAGHAAKEFYNAREEKIDFVSATNLDDVCH